MTLDTPHVGRAASPFDVNRYFNWACVLGLCLCFLRIAHAEDSIVIAPSTQPASRKLPFYLITDYLPPALYDGDALTACFRVENTTSAAASIEMTQSAFDEAGKAQAEQHETLLVPAAGFAQCQRTQQSSHCGKVQFSIRNGQQSLASVGVRLLRAGEVWPATKVKDGRLYVSESDDVLVPLVGKRLKVQDRAFAPIKWVVSPRAETGSIASGRKFLFIPAQWQLDPAKIKQEAIVLPQYAQNGAAPILCAADLIVARLTAQFQAGALTPVDAASASVLLCLPPGDLELATEPRLYRTVLEMLLSRIEILGIKRVTIIPSFHYGANEKHCQALWHETHEAAAAYSATLADPAEYLDEKLWRVDPDEAGVYGLCPNANGLEKLAQGLVGLMP